MRYALVGYNPATSDLEVELNLPEDKVDSVKTVVGVANYATVVNQTLTEEQAGRALGVLELENMGAAASMFNWFFESVGE